MGTCDLDHMVPVRQAFAGSVQILQRENAERERAAHEFEEPGGVMEYAEPQAASFGF